MTGRFTISVTGHISSTDSIAEKRIQSQWRGYDNYSYGLEAQAPEGMLDFGWKIFRALDIPCVSMDVARDGRRFYLLESVCLFWHAGILRKYQGFSSRGVKWDGRHPNEGIIEKTYAYGITWYLKERS